jgi:iron complex outermembrane receptor protein
VLNPTPKLTITIDAYQTTIRDRIIISSSFYGYRGSYCASSLYNASGTSPTLAGCVSTFSQDLYNLYNQSSVINAVTGILGSIPSYVTNNATGTANTSGSVAVQTFANGVKMRTRGIDFRPLTPPNCPAALAVWTGRCRPTTTTTRCSTSPPCLRRFTSARPTLRPRR